MGLADDAYNTRPLLNLLVQLRRSGGILIATGSCIDLFEANWLNRALTLLGLGGPGAMNSSNMHDNME
ncbi:MAG: hypothetical protein H6590_04560 [Flavobacteriales bacterium]|nr:hypothetical protein [Flavobacteriales bacterium]